MALIGANIDDGMYEGLRKASEFKGAPTLGIGGAGDTKVLRFDPHVVKKHIKKWVETRPKFKFMGVEDLISAEKHGQLRQGLSRLLLISISEDNSSFKFISSISEQMIPFSYKTWKI